MFRRGYLPRFLKNYTSLRRYLEWGKAWSFLAGDDTSQTQYAASDDDGGHVWNHPIDVHFATASMQGWPRIIMQLWELDEYGRSILAGYGFAHFPTNPGKFQLVLAEVYVLKPSHSAFLLFRQVIMSSRSVAGDQVDQ
jgi:hypothetical protein